MAAKQQSYATNGNYNSYNHTNSSQDRSASGDPTGQLSIPLTLSILLSESLFTSRYSPASTLILPFCRVTIPYGYVIIIFLELITAFYVKWSALHFSGLNSVHSFTQPSRSSDNDTNNQQGGEDTPLFPKGMTINLSFSAPFSDPQSKVATLYTIELLEIRRIPGYIVALLTLVLYFALYPLQKANGNTRSQ